MGHEIGADGKFRSYDTCVFSAVLYHLSYVGFEVTAVRIACAKCDASLGFKW